MPHTLSSQKIIMYQALKSVLDTLTLYRIQQIMFFSFFNINFQTQEICFFFNILHLCCMLSEVVSKKVHAKRI